MGRRRTLLAVFLVIGVGVSALGQATKPDTATESTQPGASATEAATPASDAATPATDTAAPTTETSAAKTPAAQPKARTQTEAQTEYETPIPILAKIKAAEENPSLTMIGRSDGHIFIVERDGSTWEANKRQLTFYNQATPRVVEASRVRAEEAAADIEKAAGIAKQRAEEKAKEDKAKADAKQAADEKAKEEKKTAEKAKEREDKITSNYVNKEYKYGPNSVPESEEKEAPAGKP